MAGTSGASCLTNGSGFGILFDDLNLVVEPQKCEGLLYRRSFKYLWRDFSRFFLKKKMELIKVCQWADVPKSGQIGGKAGIPACWQLEAEYAAKSTKIRLSGPWTSLNRVVLSDHDSVCYVLGRYSLLHIKYNIT